MSTPRSTSRPTARNADTPPGTDPDPANTPANIPASTAAAAPAQFTARERWTLLGASLWLVAGLQLDAFAHSTIPDLETFWTPWHAVMYSGIAACGLTLLWLLRSRLPQVVTYRSLLRETPSALRLPGIGMGLLLVGGGIDTLWHNLFGIERGLEIFFSPSHYFIIAGMVLVASGPALMLSASSAPSVRHLRGADAVAVVASAVLAVIPVQIYTLHASALAEPMLGTGPGPWWPISEDALMFHAYVGSTVLLLVPILILSRRWDLPLGAPTALVAAPAFVMCLVLGDPADAWLPVTVTVVTAVVELAARILTPGFRRLAPDARWVVLGFVAPIVVWSAVLGVSTVTEGGTYWNLHMISGLVSLVGLTGAGTAYVVRRLQVGSVPAAAQAPAAQ
ncbi:hypothetical protein AB1046_05270 [Promicromonospora sp. Populi]|uniref:hypothetical protein n=1 Tax=Promicromonospora sp. Populi TaxID=3239420 RepID=UPI0034E1CC2C